MKLIGKFLQRTVFASPRSQDTIRWLQIVIRPLLEDILATLWSNTDSLWRKSVCQHAVWSCWYSCNIEHENAIQSSSNSYARIPFTFWLMLSDNMAIVRWIWRSRERYNKWKPSGKDDVFEAEEFETCYPNRQCIIATPCGAAPREQVILPHVIYRKLYNHWQSPITAKMGGKWTPPGSIKRNAYYKCVTSGKVMVVFLPYPFSFVYRLIALGLTARVFVPDVV